MLWAPAIFLFGEIWVEGGGVLAMMVACFAPAEVWKTVLHMCQP